jgi:hypothetical protein
MPGQLCTSGGGIRKPGSAGGILVPVGGAGSCGCMLQLQLCTGASTNFFTLPDSRLSAGTVVGYGGVCYLLVKYAGATTPIDSSKLSVMSGCSDARCSGTCNSGRPCCFDQTTTIDVFYLYTAGPSFQQYSGTLSYNCDGGYGPEGFSNWFVGTLQGVSQIGSATYTDSWWKCSNTATLEFAIEPFNNGPGLFGGTCAGLNYNVTTTGSSASTTISQVTVHTAGCTSP